jgi:hypothetical protein
MPDIRRATRRLSDDEDVAAARSWWKTHAPTDLRDVIDAKVKDQSG